MATQIEIYNGALSKIGAPRISSLTEDSEQRRKTDDFYTTALEATLEAYGWRFARERVQLAREVSTPAFGYTYQYTIPSNCIRILEVYNDQNISTIEINDYSGYEVDWQEENGKLLTNEEYIYIVYTRNETNVAKFPPMFVEAFEYKLASMLAIPLVNNRSLMEDMETLYQNRLIDAQVQDAKKRTKRKSPQKSTWLTSRSNPVGSFVNVIRVT